MTDLATTGTQPVDPHVSIRVVALLPEPETVASCLDCALAATRGFAPTVTAVHVGFDAGSARVSAEELAIQQLRERSEGTAAQRRARIRAAFDDWASRAADRVAVAWHDGAGDVGARVVDEAGRADLVVIGRPIHLDARDALHSALFRVHRLVLIAPRAMPEGGRAIGHHVVVGWKPGEPARHAVSAARPWLARADRVTVLCVAKPGAEPYEPSALALFGDLGVAAEIVTLGRDSRSVGDQLLGEARRLGGDCLVIGAYKHGALWETLLGGVTRDVLAHAEIPVLMMR